MLGRLNESALPFYSAIALGGAASEVLAGLIIVGLLLYYKKVGYLWNEWLTTVDHKRVGVMYVVMALVMLIRGFADAAMMRAQQAISLNSEGYLPPMHFNQVFTSHGTIMIFFVIMAFLTGLMNILVPLQIGARDVAFPRLNAMSFYFTFAGAALVLISLVIGEFSKAGWTGYAPYSGAGYDSGNGVDYWIWALLISGIGTTLTGLNFITTIVRKRAPGMTWMRMPLFTWTALISSVLMVFAFPALTAALILLELDRVAGMHFFTNDLGGNAMLYVNILWVWGHPEVYILILPAFGIFSEVVSTFSRKRLFGYESLVYATAAIGFLSFTVWLHHFFSMGASADLNSFFGIATMIISVPTGVKVFDWIFTMFRGRIWFHPSMHWTIFFILLFVIGGMTGVMLALPPVDYLFHNSTFLIAHFHNVLIPGALFGLLAGMNYWFPKVFGFKLDEKWGLRAVYFWTFGFLFAFMPLYALGLMGMPRRMDSYQTPEYQPLLIVAAFGAVLVAFGIACQIVQLIVSIKNRHNLVDLTGDPWNGRSLEWSTSSPPPAYNFAVIPTVDSRDIYWEEKQKGVAYRMPAEFEDILMPKNTSLTVVIGIGSLVLGFAFVWYMWWLVVLSAIVILGATIAMAFQTDTHTLLLAADIERMERERWKIARPLLQARDAEEAAEFNETIVRSPA